ncbi:hypothetical protein GQ457_02G040350 [Hibiscus cannabinus]
MQSLPIFSQTVFLNVYSVSTNVVVSPTNQLMVMACAFALDVHGFITYQTDEPRHLFFSDKHKGKCNACGHEFAHKCKDCTFALHMRCVSLPPYTARHKCDEHPLTHAYQGSDDYPLRHYCDICEEERDPQQ